MAQARMQRVEAGLISTASPTTLGEAARITSGLTLGPSRRELSDRAPYLRVANVQRGKFDLSEIKKVGATPAEIETKRVDRGDVLVVEGHASTFEVGRAAMWDLDETPLHQNHLFRVRATNSFRPAFLLETINSETGRGYIRTVAKSTSGLNTINSTVLKAMPLRAAGLDEQDDLLTSLLQIDSAGAKNDREAVAITDLRNTLLAEIFGGN